MAVERRPVVGVMGSGVEPHDELAAPLGRLLAARGGVMASVSRAFADAPGRRGRVIGVLPGAPDPPPGYPNAWVEIAIRTHLPYSGDRGTDPLSRNHLNVLSSDAIVALPGSAGTRSELRLAIRYARPAIAFGAAWRAAAFAGIPVADTLEEVARFLDGALGMRPPA